MIYLDSTALVKLVLPEPESAALFQFLEAHPERVTSAVARIEVMRVIRRATRSPRALERAGQVLDRIAIVPLDDEVIAGAARLDPATLQSLDALHIATALSLPLLDAFDTYDPQRGAAAVQLGCEVVSPG